MTPLCTFWPRLHLWPQEHRVCGLTGDRAPPAASGRGSHRERRRCLTRLQSHLHEMTLHEQTAAGRRFGYKFTFKFKSQPLSPQSLRTDSD